MAAPYFQKLHFLFITMKHFYAYEGKLATHPIAAFMYQHAPQYSGVLVDVGCGFKPYKNFFVHIKQYIGVNITQNDEVDIISDGKSVPLPDASADVVVSNQVIEHDCEPGKILEELYRLLKPGGVLMLSAPQMARLHGEPYDFYRFTKWGLTYLLEKHGFKIKLMESHGGFFRAIGSHWNFFLIENFGTRPFFKWALRLFVIQPNNVFFSFLDKMIRWDKDTLGYNILAFK